MADGDGHGFVYDLVPGFDPGSCAVRPSRGPDSPNRMGVALQSSRPLSEAGAITVELLLKFHGFDGEPASPIGVAVGTAPQQDRWGLFVSAVDEAGQLGLLRRAEQSWPEESICLEPHRWYYLAATYQLEAGRTRVNCYLADLNGSAGELDPVVKGQVVEGLPAFGPLGVGKGFDPNGKDAYAWPGVLDELAIYDTVLPPETLQEHVNVLTRKPPDQQAEEQVARATGS
jgi:hypothetical protein